MGWNIFKKRDKEPTLEERIELALQKAKQDKRLATKEIKDIKEWAADAIIDVYSAFFPNSNLTYYRKQYAETALQEYDNIKKKYSSEVDAEMVEKCDKIVEGYMNQIKLRESKLKLFQKLEEEYSKTKEKLRMAEKQGERTDNLKEHTERLENMDDSAESLSTAMTDTYKLEDIKDDIAVKEEYFNQLEKLTNQFTDESDYNTSLAFKEEIDKMIDKI
jgi:DNA-binding SARP family transcriptional activator